MTTNDTSMTHPDASKSGCVMGQPTTGQAVTEGMTHLTHFRQESHTRARVHAHAEVTEKRVRTCHVSCQTEPASVDADAKRYATCDYDDPAKPVYTPADDVLEFKRSVRFAAIDVMILAFAARRHAEWLDEIGVCPPDVAKLIRNDLAYITHVLDRERQDVAAPPPASEGLGDVGPRSPGPPRATTPTPTLFDATRGDVGQTGPSEVITGEAYTQYATATAVIVVPRAVIMTITWSGEGETQDPDFELMSLYVNGNIVGSAHAPGGGQGCAAMAQVVSDPAPPQQVTLQPGTHTLFIDATTNDPLYHFGAWYRFDLTFQEAP